MDRLLAVAVLAGLVFRHGVQCGRDGGKIARSLVFGS